MSVKGSSLFLCQCKDCGCYCVIIRSVAGVLQCIGVGRFCVSLKSVDILVSSKGVALFVPL